MKKRRLLNQIGCEIGENTKIVGPIYYYQPFKIGKDCWVGKNFTVNGDGGVVASCACVVRKIADDYLVGGVPARRIKQLKRTLHT